MRKTKQDAFFHKNQKVGHWTIVEPKPKLVKYDLNRFRRFILVKCECGTSKWVNASVLRRGESKSCGCFTYGKGKGNSNWTGTTNVSGTFFCKVKYSAGARNLPFTITIHYLTELLQKQQHRCALSGIPILVAESKWEETTASVDRLDCTKGYIPGNVQWVHKSINLMKQSLSDADFVVLCERVNEWSKKNGTRISADSIGHNRVSKVRSSSSGAKS